MDAPQQFPDNLPFDPAPPTPLTLEESLRLERLERAAGEASRDPVPVLSLITNRRGLVGRTVDEVVKAAVQGGVNHVQLRELDLNARELLTLAEWMREVIGTRAVFVVHERVDVALAAEADGVQLTPQSLPTRVVRKLVGSQRLIGRTTYSLNDAVRAARDGADYVLLGPVYDSAAHPKSKLLEVDTIALAAQRLEVPLIAFGGLNQGNLAAIIKAGAVGIAVSAVVMMAANPMAAAEALHNEIEFARSSKKS